MRSPGARKEDWIGNHLRRVYDVALGEPVPQQMIELLSVLDTVEEDDRASAAEAGQDQGAKGDRE